MPTTAAAPTTAVSGQEEVVKQVHNLRKRDESQGPTAQQGSTKGKAGFAATEAAAATATADTREQAGCTLWDMSADERHASAMCSAGLVAVSCAVLRCCADSNASAVAAAPTEALAVPKEIPNESAGTKLPAIVTAAEAAEAPEAREGAPSIRSDAQEVERLREIACGLLANACSHRNLR